MIEVTQATPSADSTNVYLNQSITITFNKHIKTAFLVDEYIKLYRVYEEAGQDKYQQTNIIISEGSDNSIIIKPAINLLKESVHTLLIRGDSNVGDGVPSGIQSNDDDVLDGNYMLSFTTGTELTPAEEETVPTYDVSVDDDIPISGGEGVLTVLETSIPDLTYDVEKLPSFDITFSEQVDITTIKAVSAVTRNLDPRYMEKVNLIPKNILVSGDIAKVTFDGTVCISGTSLIPSDECDELPYNHEYELSINKDYIQGTTSGAVLEKSQSVQFSSVLLPMYADPFDVREAGLGYIGDNIPDYLIAKMLHANSKRIAKYFKIDYYTDPAIDAKTYDRIYNYVVCKTTYDLLRSPMVASATFGARIGSKSLGDLSISYDYGDKSRPPLDDLKDELKDCYSFAQSGASVSTGVKSRTDQYYPGRRRALRRVRSDALKKTPKPGDITNVLDQIEDDGS